MIQALKRSMQSLLTYLMLIKARLLSASFMTCVWQLEQIVERQRIYSLLLIRQWRTMISTGIIKSALVLTIQILIWETEILLNQEFWKKARICGWLKLPFIPPSSSFWRTSLSGDSGLWHGDHQIDMYYFFKNSTWRKRTLLECLEFMVQEWDNMSRFVKIRWLSLETCCNKEFKNFPSLKPIFLSRTDNSLGNDEIRAATKEGKNRIR